ncbi:hypothetical protein Mpsy_2830 [Methanolobus psychrophilus R15]|nr:hypothetical protein Mpsy_2830 [Methanolobus psychrophilus R15]
MTILMLFGRKREIRAGARNRIKCSPSRVKAFTMHYCREYI